MNMRYFLVLLSLCALFARGEVWDSPKAEAYPNKKKKKRIIIIIIFKKNKSLLPCIHIRL